MDKSSLNQNTITIDSATAKFFVGPPANGSKCAIYQEAARRAYGDMSRHTLHFTNPHYCRETKDAIALREELKVQIGCLLCEKENEILSHPKEYDKKHKVLCDEVSDIFTTTKDRPESICIAAAFSMGQAQKVVNMVWKYVYMFYQYFYATNKSFARELKRFKAIIPYLHAPVDSRVIEAATKKNSEYLSTSIPWNKKSWSKLNYDEYMDFQNKLRDILADDKITPFQWELKYWPFSPNDKKGGTECSSINRSKE